MTLNICGMKRHLNEHTATRRSLAFHTDHTDSETRVSLAKAPLIEENENVI